MGMLEGQYWFVVHPLGILGGFVAAVDDLLEPLRPNRSGRIPVAGPESAQPRAMPPWGIVAAGIHGWAPLDTLTPKCCDLSVSLTAHLFGVTNIQHQYMHVSGVVVVVVLVVVVGRLEIGTPTECAGTAEGGKALPGPGLELARRK